MKSESKVANELAKVQHQMERFDNLKTAGFNTITDREEEKMNKKSKSSKMKIGKSGRFQNNDLKYIDDL